MVDRFAWYGVRLIGLLQWAVCSCILLFYHPNPCRQEEFEDFQFLHSGVFSGNFLFNSKSPDDVPAGAREKLLLLGRVIFILSLVIALQIILEGIFG